MSGWTDDHEVAAQLPKQLEQLIIHERNFATLEQSLDVFCPFEATGMVRAEIRHGAYLANILDPFRPHGFGARFLRAFLMCAVRQAPELAEGLGPLDLHLADLERAEIRREWANIDLLIVIPAERIIVAVELKIDASQSNGQLEKYYNKVEETWRDNDETRWRRIYVFLTKNTEEPAHAAWIPLSLEKVSDALEAACESIAGNNLPLAMLKAYVEMLRRRHLEDKRLISLAASIWARHGDALEFLMNNRPDAVGSAFEHIKANATQIAKTISSAELNVVPDDHTSSIVRFGIATWDRLPRMLQGEGWTGSGRFLLFEIKRNGQRIDGAFYLGPGDRLSRQKILQALTPLRANKRGGQDWTLIAGEKLFDGANSIDIETDEAIKLTTGNFAKFLNRVGSQAAELLASV